MSLAQEGDSMEVAQAFRATLEKKRVPAKVPHLYYSPYLIPI